MNVINTALLSFGLSGRAFHAPLLHFHAGFSLAGCWERSAKSLQGLYPQANSYDSFEQLLSDPDIELVVVNTPTATHFDYARQALEHGKHVLVEKAFTTTADEAVRLAALARRQRRKLAVYQNRRWDSDFQSVYQVLQQGLIGDVVEANLAFCRYNPALSVKAHKEQPGPGAGIVKDLGAHVIDQALLLFGMPVSVFADIGITRQHSRVDDYFDILLLYTDKRVHVKGGYFYKQPLPEYTVFGTRGSFHKTRSDVQETQLLAGITPADPGYGKEPDSSAGTLFTNDSGEAGVRSIISPRGNYLQLYDGLYKSIQQDVAEPVTAAEGIRVMQIIDAAFESRSEGRVVRI
ncbi:MAG: Gfo/Idh/MocA family oxidoreductase [Gammaproteobacteria bacterium]|nr:Gfo/Idh/MocA family oxidoreductase [Gammaproteobacteria bacterium]MDH5304468.1 Gfo/Idh/MocA family oxidoreductase [Gammaproteobacteria bacterium]MDH5321704.1 Gfo/Idh/MocA family oxidoreductase [Gammaproteobacteria bacterium]